MRRVVLEFFVFVFQTCRHIWHTFGAFVAHGGLQTAFGIVDNLPCRIGDFCKTIAEYLPPNQFGRIVAGGAECQVCLFEKRITQHRKLLLYVANHIAHIGAVVHLVTKHLGSKGEGLLAAVLLVNKPDVGAPNLVFEIDSAKNYRIFRRHVLVLFLADG